MLSTISRSWVTTSDGRAGLVDPVEQLHHADRGDRVEVAAGLVGEQQRRVVDEGAGDRDALLLAAGELVGVAVELGREADQAQRLRHLGADLGAAGADHLQRVGDVVVDGAVGQQLEVLEDGADVAPQLRDLLLRQGADVAAGDADACPRSPRARGSAVLIRVDLPQPVGPTRKTNSPRSIASETRSSAMWPPG